MRIQLIEEILEQLDLSETQKKYLEKKIVNFAMAFHMDSDFRKKAMDSLIVPAYRVWSKSEKKFLTPEEVAIMANGKILRYSCQDDLSMNLCMEWREDIDTDNYFVQRYTEVEDKDNNPIYEGDIVVYNLSWLGRPDEVKLKNNSNFNKWKSEILYKDTRTSQREIQIVGNIFENPDLLSDSNS